MIRKRISAVLLMMTIASVLIMGSAMPADAAGNKYDLPSKVREYYKETDEDGNIVSDKWKTGATETFKYNKKGHLVNYKKKYTDGATETETAKWTYKKGKISKCVTNFTYKDGNNTDKRKYVALYKKGRLTEETVIDKYEDGTTGKSASKYFYNKKGWINKRTYRIKNENAANNIKLTYYKNGMPKTMSLNVPGFGSMSGYRWKFDFNNKGLLNTEYLITAFDGKKDIVTGSYVYEYDDKGRVKTVYRMDDTNKSIDYGWKLEYEYGNSGTSDRRVYFGIMNKTYASLITGHDVVPGPFYFMR